MQCHSVFGASCRQLVLHYAWQAEAPCVLDLYDAHQGPGAPRLRQTRSKQQLHAIGLKQAYNVSGLWVAGQEVKDPPSLLEMILRIGLQGMHEICTTTAASAVLACILPLPVAVFSKSSRLEWSVLSPRSCCQHSLYAGHGTTRTRLKRSCWDHHDILVVV